MVNFKSYGPVVGTAEDGRDREQIKRLIREGHVVHTPRQCGATTALMEVLHEEFADRASPHTVIFAGAKEAARFIVRYSELFPEDDPLRFVCVATDPSRLRGQLRVFVDGFDRFPGDFRIDCQNSPVKIAGLA